MAIYTGFFDAAFDETTSTYDNEYDSADFTTYFGEIVGSGVCVYGNDDSMRVYYDAVSNRAVVNPGYLFIRGYWLKNDGLYTVSLESLSAGTYAIYAELNLGSRGIVISQKAKVDPEVYPDAIVLAYATIDIGGAISIEDTRSRTDICGLIDSAGSLSMKIEYAINYIDNEIEEKLNQIEQNLQQKEAEIDSKIEEVNALISQIAPPAIGTIKFSASQNIEEGWIKCYGSFISETDTIINTNAIPYVISKQTGDDVRFYVCTCGSSEINSSGEKWYSIHWSKSELENAILIKHEMSSAYPIYIGISKGEYTAYSHKNNNEMLVITERGTSDRGEHGGAGLSSYPDAVFDRGMSNQEVSYDAYQYYLSETLNTYPIVGNAKVLVRANLTNSLIYFVDRAELTYLQKSQISDISLPSSTRTFKDGYCYLWSKDRFFIFAVTGIIFKQSQSC